MSRSQHLNILHFSTPCYLYLHNFFFKRAGGVPHKHTPIEWTLEKMKCIEDKSVPHFSHPSEDFVCDEQLPSEVLRIHAFYFADISEHLTHLSREPLITTLNYFALCAPCRMFSSFLMDKSDWIFQRFFYEKLYLEAQINKVSSLLPNVIKSE